MLDAIVIDLTDAYSKGRIDEIRHSSLKNETIIQYDRRNNLDVTWNSADSVYSKDDLNKLLGEMEKALSKQKITQTQFDLLVRKISDLKDKNSSKENKFSI